MSARGLMGRAAAYFRDPSVSRWRKLAGLGAVAYVLLPVDVIPDLVPVFGWLDDLGVLSAAATLVLRDIQRHAQRRSSESSIR